MIESISIIFAGKVHMVIAVIAVVYFLFAPCASKIKLAGLGALALPLSYVVAKTVGMVIETTRPFVELGVFPLIEHSADNGFPSEHTLYALIIAGVIYTVHKKLGSILVVLGIFVGIGRVLTLVHNPIDILGSGIIAFAVLGLIMRSSYMQYLETLMEQFGRNIDS